MVGMFASSAVDLRFDPQPGQTQYFSYILEVSFIGGGKWSIRRKPLTCCKSLTNFITLCCRVHLAMSGV
jgi:hypothetical protein